MALIKFTCPSCGGSVTFQEGKDTVFCEYCGAQLHFQEEVTNAQKAHQDEIDALTDRIYQLIASKKFVQAQTAANEGLLKLPYSGRLHLCLLLAELNLDAPEKLATCGRDYTASENYRNCLRYMTPEDRADLLRLAEQNGELATHSPSPLYTASAAPAVSSAGATSEAGLYDDLGDNSPDVQKQRVQEILSQNLSAVQKIREIAENPYSDLNIIDYIIENGPDLNNMIDPERLEDDNGDSFVDFVDSNNTFYFKAIQELLPAARSEIRSTSPDEDVDLIKDAQYALELWDKLNDIEMALSPDEDASAESLAEGYNQIQQFIKFNYEYALREGRQDTPSMKAELKRQAQAYVTEQTEAVRSVYRDSLSPEKLQQLMALVGWTESSRRPASAPTPIRFSEKENDIPHAMDPDISKNQAKLKGGIIVGSLSVILLGIALIVFGLCAQELCLFLGALVLLFGVLFLGTCFYANFLERKRRFCPQCKKMYNYYTDVSFQEIERFSKTYKPSGNSTSKQVVQRLFAKYRIDCKCHNCGMERSYTRKLKYCDIYDDGSSVVMDDEEALIKELSKSSVIGTEKRENKISWIVGIACAALSVVLFIMSIVSAVSGGGGSLPRRYLTTYYTVNQSALFTFDFDKYYCDITIDTGIEYEEINDCEYEYVSAEEAQRHVHNSLYENHRAIFIHYNGQIMVLWETGDDAAPFELNAPGHPTLTTTSITLSEYMGDPGDYYKTYTTDQGGTLRILPDGSVTSSFSEYSGKRALYVNAEWLTQFSPGKYNYEKALIIYDKQATYVLEYLNADTLRTPTGTTFHAENSFGGSQGETQSPTPSEIAGIYYMWSVYENGEEYTGYEPMAFAIQLMEDGSFTGYIDGYPTMIGTWKTTGSDRIVINDNSDDTQCRCDGTTLIMQIDTDYYYVLTKGDAPTLTP